LNTTKSGFKALYIEPKNINKAILKFMENKYNEGEIVYAKINPTLKLVIRRYVKRIYYCKVQEDPSRKDLVYFERELMARPGLIEKK